MRKWNRLSLASAHQEPADASETRKVCVNVYSEKDQTLPGVDRVLRAIPGAVDRDAGGVITGTVRGIFQEDGFADGATLIIDGTTVRTYKNGTWGSLTGTLTGTDQVTVTYSQTECAFLSSGVVFVSKGETIRHATDGLTSDPSLAIGVADTAEAKFSGFTFLLSGTAYTKTSAEAPLGSEVVPVNKYGAVALDIDVSGTIAAVSSPDNETGYTTSSQAITDLPVVAYDKVRIGYVAVRSTSGAFTFGTTPLDDDDANTDVIFSDGQVKSTGLLDLLEQHGVDEVTSITSIGQRLVFTYGNQFGFSDPFDFGKTTAISYYTSERFPDENVAAFANGSELWISGTDSLEPWYETGDNDKPFRPLVGREIPKLGLLNKYCIISTGTTLISITPEYVVMAMPEASPQQISPNWVSRELKGKDVRMMVHTFEGHVFIFFRTDDLCIVFDATENKWVLRKTYGSETWQFKYMVEVAGNIFVASDSAFAELDRDTKTELGDPIVLEFTGHYAPMERGTVIGAVRATGAFAVGESSYDMAMSFDGGHVKGNYHPRRLGDSGDYGGRPIWTRCGSARRRPVVSFFRFSAEKHFMLQYVEWSGQS